MRILVLEARGLNLGFLGCYGNDWIATPNLDRLAAEGVVFDQHIHDCPDSSPDCQPALGNAGGNSISPHILADVAGFGRAVLERFQSTAADLIWIDGPNLAPPWNVPDDLRDVYFDDLDGPGEDGDGLEPWTDPPCAVVGEATIAELLELHNSYAAAVTWFDAQVGALIEGLRDAGDLDNLLLVVTARSGLPLAEHGVIGPARAWLHEELIHVPLVMRFPDRQFAGLRVPALTQPGDLLATIGSLQNNPTESTAGQDVLPLLRGEASVIRAHAFSHLQIGDSVESALRTPEWALLLPVQAPVDDPLRAPQLFVKPSDRWEVNDVRTHHPELAEELEQILRAYRARTAPSTAPPPDF